jgi:hypothetical protein
LGKSWRRGGKEEKGRKKMAELRNFRPLAAVQEDDDESDARRAATITRAASAPLFATRPTHAPEKAVLRRSSCLHRVNKELFKRKESVAVNVTKGLFESHS